MINLKADVSLGRYDADSLALGAAVEIASRLYIAGLRGSRRVDGFIMPRAPSGTCHAPCPTALGGGR